MNYNKQMCMSVTLIKYKQIFLSELLKINHKTMLCLSEKLIIKYKQIKGKFEIINGFRSKALFLL